MTGFPDMIRTLERYGISDVLLPFIIIFTVVFAILQKTKLLGDGRKSFNVVIALAMALGPIIMHVLGKFPSKDSDIIVIMNKALPQVSIILIAILMLLIIMGIFGAEIQLAGATMGGWFMVIAIIIIAAIFGNAAGWFKSRWFDWLTMNSDVRNLVIIILVFGIIIAFITNDTTDSKKTDFFKGIGDGMAKLIHGGKGGGGH